MGKLGGALSKLSGAVGSFFGAQSMLQSDGSLVITSGGAQALTNEQIEAFLDSIAGAGVGALAAEAFHLIAESSGIPDDYRQLKEDIQEAETGGGEVKPVDTGDLKVIETRSAETANAEWAERGYTNPPYDPKYEVKIVEAGNEEYVRVYSYDEAGKANKAGQWIMKKSDIQGLTPAEIADKYALPKEPTHMCDVNLPPDYRLECGIANGIDGWGSGGGLQFDFMGQRIANSSFLNEVVIGG